MRMRSGLISALLAVGSCLSLVKGAPPLSARTSPFPDLYEATFQELQDGLDAGAFTSVDLVKAYLGRIAEVNHKGPKLQAVIETSPVALIEASKLDAERKAGKSRGILHGIPILLKDNIDTRHSDGMNTTAGSYALVGTTVPGDAHVTALLRGKGAIILGKANLSQWAFWRSNNDLPSGWSSVGGQCTNPYYPNGTPSGSSGGSGIAAAIGLCAAAIGSDTGGSVIYPASYQNLVGVRPTIGLVSRTGVVPITNHHDTTGPMARTVTDAAHLLSIMAGKDATDNYTLAQPAHVPNYSSYLRRDALKGVRLGVPRAYYLNFTANGLPSAIGPVFERALSDLRALGAVIVDDANFADINTFLNGTHTYAVWDADFQEQVAAYFQRLLRVPSGVKTLKDLINFNNNHPNLERPGSYASEDIFYESEATQGYDTPNYRAWVQENSIVGKGMIDATLKEYNVSALIFPSPQSFGWAKAGYPQVTLPLGFLPQSTKPVQVQDHPERQTYDPFPGMPFGLTFAGTGYSEAKLLAYAYAFEQKTHHRLEKKAYTAAIPKTQLKDVVA